MHKVENHCGLHSVNFLISFFHLIQHGKLGFPFPYIFLIVLHRLYFLVEIVANDVADIPLRCKLITSLFSAFICSSLFSKRLELLGEALFISIFTC